MIKYQRANNLAPNGITDDEIWNSIYRKKRDREEKEAFYKEIKEKEGGYFYEKIKSIRKAQRAMGIEPEGVLEGEEEEADNSGIFKNGIGTRESLTLSMDPSHGVLPVSANPSYKTNNDWLMIAELEFSAGIYQIIGITVCFSIACLVKYLLYRRKAKKASC